MWKERMVNVNDSILIRKKLYKLNDSEDFEDFDRFLMKKVLGKEQIQELLSEKTTDKRIQQLREEAYLIFYKEVKADKVASRTTIKRWFGLNGYGRPKRKQIFKLAFALKLGEKELEEYLVQGILQPGVQINDYREMIYRYGIDRSLSYEECVDMIRVFEKHVYKDTVIEQNTHTALLWEMYRANCTKPKEEFLLWMCSNAGFFKGYSKVALRHFMEMKSQMLAYIRQNAREQLFILLEETDFREWAAENGLSKEDYGDNIYRYIKNVSRRKGQGNLDPDLKEAILECNWVAYSSRDKTTDLLAELYASAIETGEEKIRPQKRISYKDRNEFMLPDQIHFMTDKHISQIIGIAQQKEKEIRLSQALGSLEDAEGSCPEWIGKMLEEYGITSPADVAGTRNLLRKLLTMQEQRCHIVQRDDLLPLIHYVAQRKYEQLIQEQNESYHSENAKIFFIQMADTILLECSMAPISEKYHLDYLLLSCYGEDYMYSLADVIEEAGMLE